MLVLIRAAGAAVSGLGRRDPIHVQKYRIGPLLRFKICAAVDPFIFGMLLIVPPQAYDQILESLAIPPDSLISTHIHYLPSSRSSAVPVPASSADLEPSVVRGLFVGLHHGTWRRSGGGPSLSAGSNGGSHPLCRACGSLSSIGRVCGLPPDLVAELSFDAALFGDWYNHMLFATGSCSLSARRATNSGTRSSVSAGWRCRSQRRSFWSFSHCDGPEIQKPRHRYG